MRTPSVVALLMAGVITSTVLLSGSAYSKDSPTVERLKIFVSKVVDEAVGELFPPGWDEMFEVLEDSPELMRGSLIVWLSAQMRETQQAAVTAEQRGDMAETNRLWDKVDRYQIFLSCVSPNQDCAKLKELKAAGAWTAPGAGPQSPGTPTQSTFNDPRTDKGNFVDRCYAFASGCDDNDNPDPAAKPAANEFCKRKGYASVALGGSKWSYKAPTEILSSGELCTDPKGCGGLDFVKCQ
jgi:hypothetical protein